MFLIEDSDDSGEISIYYWNKNGIIKNFSYIWCGFWLYIVNCDIFDWWNCKNWYKLDW